MADTESSGLGDDVPQIGPVAHADADQSDVDPDGEDPEISRESPLFARDGNRILWDGAHIGSITAWGRSISCSCRLPGHRKCRTPASTKFPSDTVLIDWLLLGLVDGVDKDSLCAVCVFAFSLFRCLLLALRWRWETQTYIYIYIYICTYVKDEHCRRAVALRDSYR